jgi:hypothetical protein
LAPSNDAYLLQLGHQFLRKPARISCSHMRTPPESVNTPAFLALSNGRGRVFPCFLTSEFVLAFCPCSCPAASG